MQEPVLIAYSDKVDDDDPQIAIYRYRSMSASIPADTPPENVNSAVFAVLGLDKTEENRRLAGKAAFADISELAHVTAAQAEAWIDNNVTDLSSAIDFLKVLARGEVALRDLIIPDLEK